jgi:hypothetical protein
MDSSNKEIERNQKWLTKDASIKRKMHLKRENRMMPTNGWQKK